MHTNARSLGIAVILVLGLSACTATSGNSAPESSPSHETTATPATPLASSPSATPVEVAPASVTGLILRANDLSIEYTDGTTSTADYFSLASDIVPVLTEAFGAEPEVTHHQPELEPGSFTEYAWDGFSLYDDDAETLAPLYSNFLVIASAPSINGVTIVTVDGISVGTSAADVAAQHPESAQVITPQGQGDYLYVRVDRLPLPVGGENADGLYEWSVGLTADDPAGTITRITAPAPNFGV